MSSEMPLGDKRLHLDYDDYILLGQGRKAYRLPMQGSDARADELISSISSIGATVLPTARISAAGNGAALLMVALLFIFSSFVFVNVFVIDVSVGFRFLLLVSGLLFVGIGVYVLRVMSRVAYAKPLRLNRRDGKVVQLTSGRRLEANWSELVPYVGSGLVINASGGHNYYNLHLVPSPVCGRVAVDSFLVKASSNGEVGSLQYYEFLRRYMAGDWDALPDIQLTGGARQSLWMEFRRCWWHFDLLDKPWEERSREERGWMYAWVPMLLILIWPLTFLSLIGSRLGHIPEFSDEGLKDAAGNSEGDESMPESLAKKIIPAPTVAHAEKRLYIVSALIATVVWMVPLYGIVAFVLEPLAS